MKLDFKFFFPPIIWLRGAGELKIILVHWLVIATECGSSSLFGFLTTILKILNLSNTWSINGLDKSSIELTKYFCFSIYIFVCLISVWYIKNFLYDFLLNSKYFAGKIWSIIVNSKYCAGGLTVGTFCWCFVCLCFFFLIFIETLWSKIFYEMNFCYNYFNLRKVEHITPTCKVLETSTLRSRNYLLGFAS